MNVVVVYATPMMEAFAKEYWTLSHPTCKAEVQLLR